MRQRTRTVVVIAVLVLFAFGAAAEAQQDVKPNDVRSHIEKVSPKITGPKPIKTPDPYYPPELRKAGVQGTVWMDIVVGIDGKVKNVVVKRSVDSRLNAEAINAVKKWKFRPATKDGAPFETQISVETNFRVY